MIEFTYAKMYCNVCNKYRKCRKPKISNIFLKKIILSIDYSKCDYKHEEIFKEEECNHVWRKYKLRV